MDSHAKIKRVLNMLLLLSGNRNYTIAELAEKFNTSERTIQRYIASFKETGFVFTLSEGRYRIEKMDKDFRKLSDLLHFSDEEAYLLTKAIHAVSDNNVLKANLEKKLYSLYNFDRVANSVVEGKNSDNVHKLLKAMKEQKQVLLRSYRSANSNIERDRLVEPFDFATNYIAVWAFEPESRKNKLFKTARIESVEVLDKPSEYADNHKKQTADVFRISSTKQIPVSLLLSMRAFSLLIEEFPLAEPSCTKLPDNKWQFDAQICGFDGVGRFVLGLMDEVKVLAPKGLKEYVDKKIQNRIG